MFVPPLALASALAALPPTPLAGFVLSEPTPTTAALAADDKPVMHKWTGAVNAGATIASGNTDSTNANAGADAEYRREKDRVTLKFQWNYSEEDDVVSQRRIFGAAKYDYFLSEKTYALAQTSGEYDTKANLDLRATLGVGIGRQLRDDEKWKLSGEAGLTYFDEDYVGSADDSEYLAARLAYGVEYKAIKDWLLAQTGEIYPSLEDSEDVYAKLDTKARMSLTEKMFAQFEWIYSWDNTPATGSDRVDNLYLFTLGWSF
jgi:putative salt-induced outer membrane protein YdiY